MADRRKLQGEIDRCHKKVQEGVEIFEDIWQKAHNAPNINQKEKYEADLKKEIKKLQRLRDQIKTWIASSEIKDKRLLVDDRKLIETQMERFKVLERETKTKAYSKEGLGAAQKLDPAQREKEEISNWMTSSIESLNIQIDQFESEIESISVHLRKKKNDKDKQERVDKLKASVDKHKYHINQLETLMRMLDNSTIDVSQVKRIKDDVEYYIESSQEPDFEENEFIYEDLELEDIVEFLNKSKMINTSNSSNSKEPNTNLHSTSFENNKNNSINANSQVNSNEDECVINQSNIQTSPSTSPTSSPGFTNCSKNETNQNSSAFPSTEFASVDQNKVNNNCSITSSNADKSEKTSIQSSEVSSSCTASVNSSTSTNSFSLANSTQCVKSNSVWSHASISGSSSILSSSSNINNGNTSNNNNINGNNNNINNNNGVQTNLSQTSSAPLSDSALLNSTSSNNQINNSLSVNADNNIIVSNEDNITCSVNNYLNKSNTSSLYSAAVSTSLINTNSAENVILSLNSTANGPHVLSQKVSVSNTENALNKSTNSTPFAQDPLILQQQQQISSQQLTNSSCLYSGATASGINVSSVDSSSTWNNLNSIVNTRPLSTNNMLSQPLLNGGLATSNKDEQDAHKLNSLKSMAQQAVLSAGLDNQLNTASDKNCSLTNSTTVQSSIVTTGQDLYNPVSSLPNSNSTTITSGSSIIGLLNNSAKTMSLLSNSSNNNVNTNSNNNNSSAMLVNQNTINSLVPGQTIIQNQQFSEAHIPPLLGVAPLGPISMSKSVIYQMHMLESACRHVIHPLDSQRWRNYLPPSNFPTPSYYPQQALPHSDTIEFFHKLSTETLFFIFYFMEGTKAQFLAAKTLKKQSWRFHTKFMMWFQRHEEPKTITDEYEQGTYIYFDYEKWGQRKREHFTFEYRYLEDRELN